MVITLNRRATDNQFRRATDSPGDKPEARNDQFINSYLTADSPDTGVRQVAPVSHQHQDPSPRTNPPEQSEDHRLNDRESKDRRLSERESRDCRLSSREIEILNWVKVGKTNSEIAGILCISSCTVKNHLQRIYKKLDVYNRLQAAMKIELDLSHG